MTDFSVPNAIEEHNVQRGWELPFSGKEYMEILTCGENLGTLVQKLRKASAPKPPKSSLLALRPLAISGPAFLHLTWVAVLFM